MSYVPVNYRGGRASSERMYVVAMDWTRRIFQLAIVATILLYAYLLYGLFFGDIGNWANISHNDRVRILENVTGAVNYVNIAAGILLITSCILFYDEEAFGYTLIAGSVALYYALPFALDMVFGNLLSTWESSHNQAALQIMSQLKVAAIMMAVPGAI